MTRMTKKQRSSDHLRVSGESRPPLSRAAAWREVGLTIGVLWSVLGAACFFVGAQWVYDEWGTSLNGALVLDVLFLVGCLVVIGFVRWRQSRRGEGFAELGWGRPPAHRCSSLPSSMGWPGRRWPMPEAETRWPGPGSGRS